MLGRTAGSHGVLQTSHLHVDSLGCIGQRVFSAREYFLPPEGSIIYRVFEMIHKMEPVISFGFHLIYGIAHFAASELQTRKHHNECYIHMNVGNAHKLSHSDNILIK